MKQRFERYLIIICHFVWSSLMAADIKILINHIGYESAGPKHAVVLSGENDHVESFRVINASTGKEMVSGIPQKIGIVDQWKDWIFWTLDFNDIADSGMYYIDCHVNGHSVQSCPFMIQNHLFEKSTISDVIYYFKGQRCSGLLDKADRHIPFDGDEKKVVDAHGGWYDATGDYGKHLSHLSHSTYFNPQQIPLTVWSLFQTYKTLEKRGNPNFRQYLRRLLDEAMYGADFLVRMKNPDGSFYLTVSGRGPKKLPEDRRISPSMRRFEVYTVETKDKFDRNQSSQVPDKNVYEASYRAGAGVSIGALALASTYSVSGDFESKDYLKAAENAFMFLEKNNHGLCNDGIENIVDDYCALIAGTELYKATKKTGYKHAADRRAENLIARLVTQGKVKNYFRADDVDRPFFHAADAGFPVVSLLNYIELADSVMKSKILDTVAKAMAFELEITSEVNNPFGYARQYIQDIDGRRRTQFFFPHHTETGSWWQGENARLGSLVTAARMTANLFKNDPAFYQALQSYAANQLNWILGLNPFDACMLHGSGRNNPPYIFFNSYEYTNAPGGICNGITSGFDNEHDIDFLIPFSFTGKDNDWRWGEQWLPHASWFLLAVALGENKAPEVR